MQVRMLIPGPTKYFLTQICEGRSQTPSVGPSLHDADLHWFCLGEEKMLCFHPGS